ncbi:putative outer membrane starch-binding protein [Chitinophaga niastensis]|uniref:Putative outer membrane starch-binding protein n=1 Tax=Chitinophaga niastensis TaxID=536980 RepID=A0A2P8HGV9_CHINA|nr:RagB/SusD family nutrient uptake outer membrane protein [Chitinophaga niastensis]PSL45458.1 putative outer membrane starch-binding protein [Chitinophaga niastensis]
MKSLYNILLGSAVIASAIFSSCSKSFLDHQPQAALDEAQLTNKKGVGTMLVGAYGALDGQDFVNADMVNLSGGSGFIVSPDNWIYGSVCGGDAHKGSTTDDANPALVIAKFGGIPSNGFFNDKWRVNYEGIRRCNFVLHLLTNVQDMSNQEKANAAGEARFLRAHYYADLKKMFNNVPWVDETNTSFSQLDVDQLKQPNDKDIWPMIEADFKFAYQNLNETQAEVGRANKWAAAAYLAKTYLYESNYTAALPLFETVIQNGVTAKGLHFDLMDHYHDNYDAATENNQEAVFSIQYSANDGSGGTANANQGEMLNYPYNGPFSCCGFYQPSMDLVNSYRTDANGLPFLDDYNQHALVSDMGVASSVAFTLDNGNLDPRLDWTVGRRGIPYLDWGLHPGQDWIRSQTTAGPYSPKKNVYMQATQGKYYDGNGWAPGNAINYVLIRFSDVLLMAAECQAQAGSLDIAEKYVNRVRHRMTNPDGWVHTYIDPANPLSGNTNTPAANYVIGEYQAGAFTTQGKAYGLKAIYFERKLELAMEGHRFFDLVRWKLAAPVLNKYFQFEGALISDIVGGSFTANKNEYFPIPQRQIDLSVKNGKSVLIQNPHY